MQLLSFLTTFCTRLFFGSSLPTAPAEPSREENPLYTGSHSSWSLFSLSSFTEWLSKLVYFPKGNELALVPGPARSNHGEVASLTNPWAPFRRYRTTTTGHEGGNDYGTPDGEEAYSDEDLYSVADPSEGSSDSEDAEVLSLPDFYRHESTSEEEEEEEGHRYDPYFEGQDGQDEEDFSDCPPLDDGAPDPAPSRLLGHRNRREVMAMSLPCLPPLNRRGIRGPLPAPPPLEALLWGMGGMGQRLASEQRLFQHNLGRHFRKHPNIQQHFGTLITFVDKKGGRKRRHHLRKGLPLAMTRSASFDGASSSSLVALRPQPVAAPKSNLNDSNAASRPAPHPSSHRRPKPQLRIESSVPPQLLEFGPRRLLLTAPPPRSPPPATGASADAAPSTTLPSPPVSGLPTPSPIPSGRPFWCELGVSNDRGVPSYQEDAVFATRVFPPAPGTNRGSLLFASSSPDYANCRLFPTKPKPWRVSGSNGNGIPSQLARCGGDGVTSGIPDLGDVTDSLLGFWGNSSSFSVPGISGLTAITAPVPSPLGPSYLHVSHATGCWFGIFDGHGGDEVANHLAASLPDLLLASPSSHSPPPPPPPPHATISPSSATSSNALPPGDLELPHPPLVGPNSSGLGVPPPQPFPAPAPPAACSRTSTHETGQISRTQQQQGGGGGGGASSRASAELVRLSSLLLCLEEGLRRHYYEVWLPQGRDPGSTALVAGVVEGHLLVANLGDSRLLLISEISDNIGNRTAYVSRATSDHDRNNHAEVRRVADAGGAFDAATGRLGSLLAVSRSLGDFGAKAELGPGVILAEPEIHSWRLRPEDLLVIAVSDGISSVLNDQEICNFVCTRLNDQRMPTGRVSDTTYAARELAAFAVASKHSEDNCTAVVLALNPAPPPMPARRRLFSKK